MSLNVTTVIGGAGQRPRWTRCVVAGRARRLPRPPRRPHPPAPLPPRPRRGDGASTKPTSWPTSGSSPAVQATARPDAEGRPAPALLGDARHGIDGLVRRYLDDPVTHAVDSEASAPPERSTITCSPFRRATSLRSCTRARVWGSAGAPLHPHEARRQEARRAALGGWHPDRRAARQPRPGRS